MWEGVFRGVSEGVFRGVSEGAFMHLLVYVSEDTSESVFEDAFEGMGRVPSETYRKVHLKPAECRYLEERFKRCMGDAFGSM